MVSGDKLVGMLSRRDFQKIKKNKFERSAEGKKRKKLKTRMGKSNKTATGRRKVKYNR